MLVQLRPWAESTTRHISDENAAVRLQPISAPEGKSGGCERALHRPAEVSHLDGRSISKMDVSVREKPMGKGGVSSGSDGPANRESAT